MRNLWINWVIAFFVFLAVPALGQQNNQADLELIANENFEDPALQDYQPTYLFAQSNAVVKYNPLSLMLGGMMYSYQKFVSPQISAECMYETSCSKFGVLLLKDYGLFKGVFLTADRLMRCNRFAAMDIRLDDVDRTSGKVMDDPQKFSFQHEL